MEWPTRDESGRDHVAILMATFNGERFLAAQLASLLEQTHRDWSLWVSDDGSGDTTLAIVADFARRNPDRRVRIVAGPRHGHAANFLHLLCHPDLPHTMVALCDQDDVWLPDKLARAVQVLRAGDDGPAVWAARYLVTDAGLADGRASALWARPPALANAVVQNILSGHTLTLNAAALSLVRRAGTVAVPHHDWWIYLVMAATGARITVDRAVVLQYRQHGRNTMGDKAQTRAHRLAGLLRGRMGDWIKANLAALGGSDLPLTAQAQDLLRAWREPAIPRLRLLRRYGIHRQSSRETAILYLVALFGKL